MVDYYPAWFFQMLKDADREKTQKENKTKKKNVQYDFSRLDQHVTNCFDKKGEEHARWGVFAEETVLIPVNIGRNHWVTVVLFPSKLHIQFYDSNVTKGCTPGF